MTKVRDIIDFIDGIAPFDTALDFDNVGLMVGGVNTEIKTVLVALDANAAVVSEAAEIGAQLIVTHHPVIFRPVKSIPENSIPYLAARNGITVISAHTNLDIAFDGVNDTLALAAGVIVEQRFPEDCCLIGELSGEYTSKELALHLMDKLSLRGMRYSSTNDRIKRVMVACGAGGNNVFSAASMNADAIITGEIKHHEILFANDNGLSVFDCGHFQSERVIVPVLVSRLMERFPEVSFIQSSAETELMNYLKA